MGRARYLVNIVMHLHNSVDCMTILEDNAMHDSYCVFYHFQPVRECVSYK